MRWVQPLGEIDLERLTKLRTVDVERFKNGRHGRLPPAPGRIVSRRASARHARRCALRCGRHRWANKYSCGSQRLLRQYQDEDLLLAGERFGNTLVQDAVGIGQAEMAFA